MSLAEASGPGVGRRRVTRADVARHAGVSTAVVSYTLNDGPKRVAPETRRRVLEAVRALGYRPNATARALRLGSTGEIGLIVPGVANRFYAELTDAVETAARTRGLALLIRNAARGEVPAAIEQLTTRQVDGLVIANEIGAESFAVLSSAGTRAVFIDQPEPCDGACTLGVDRAAGARRAVEHLIGHGHRSVGFIGPSGPQSHRWRGWREALREAGLPEGPVADSPYSRQGGREGMAGLLDTADCPTAVFIASDDQALGALLALHERGVEVPGQVAVAGFDGSSGAAFAWPPLTAVTQPVDQMAVRALAALAEGAPSGHEELETELVLRRSCGCVGRDG